jgi:hypothetical protein
MNMLQPVKNITEYKRIKEALRDRFDTERTGDQHLFTEQSKILEPLIKPLISTQEQTVKAIKDNRLAVDAMQAGRNAASIPAPVAQRPSDASVAPGATGEDSGLNETDIKNLQDMGFEMPDLVLKNKKIGETLDKIKTENRSLGQKLGKGSEASEKEKVIYKSWKQTLDSYKQIIHGLAGAKQFVGKGSEDVILYSNVDDLCSRLAQLYAAKLAGNTGLDNKINSVLDELLRVRAVSKNEYDNLYKNIFPII